MGESYANGWAATAQLMRAGKSWSGNERHCVYLNCRDGTFVDVSAAAGLDFIDDGRAVASSDWDGDGDVDIWLKNRTGPQLRFIRNDAANLQRSVSFDLIGKKCNRDAIGARIAVVAGGKTYTRVLCAGDGYLSQSSKRIVIGLDDSTAIDSTTIRWPDGNEQNLNGIKPGKHYRVVQDTSVQQIPNRRIPTIAPVAAEEGRTPAARLVLKVALPLAPSILKMLDIPDSTRPTLMSLWAHWCKPCHVELREILQAQKGFLETGLQLLPVNIDGQSKASEADEAWAAITDRVETEVTSQTATPELLAAIAALVEHVRGKSADKLPLPINLLISPDGQLQVIYLGTTSVDRLLEDSRTYGRNAVPAAQRFQFEGRWYFRVPRDYAELAQLLEPAELSEAAEFYRSLAVTKHKQWPK